MGDSVQFGGSGPLPGMPPTGGMGGATFSESLKQLRNSSLPARVQSAPPGTLSQGLLDRISRTSVLGKVFAIFKPNTETAAAVINPLRPQSMQVVKNGVVNEVLREAPKPPANKPVQKIKQAGVEQQLATDLKGAFLREAAFKGNLEEVKKLLQDPAISLAAKKMAHKGASSTAIANEIVKSMPAPNRPLPTTPTALEPPPIPSRANRGTTHNALKDFILHNSGFALEEGKLVKKELKVQDLAIGIAAVYEKNLDTLFSDLLSLAKEKKQNIHVQQRILEFIDAMLDSHLNDELCRKDLKSKESALKQIIAIISEHQELSAPAAQVMKKYAEIPSTRHFEVASTAKNELDSATSAIRSGKMKPNELKSHIEGFAADSRDYFASLYRLCNSTDFIMLDRGGAQKSFGESFLRIINAYNNLSNRVQTEVLEGKTIKESVHTVSVYIKIAAQAVTNGDFATAHAIYAGLNTPALTRFTHLFEKLDSGSQKQLAELADLFNPTKNYANYLKKREEFASSIPMPALMSMYTDKLGEALPTFTQLTPQEKIPNLHKILTTARSFQAGVGTPSRVPIGKCDSCPAYLAIHETSAHRLSEKELYALSLERQPRKR